MPNPSSSKSFVALALVAVLALAGCEITGSVRGPRTWTAAVEATSGRTSIIQVGDTSGRIDDAEIDPADLPAMGDIANPPGQPNVVVVPWTGGACDERTDIAISGAGNGLSIEIRITTAPGDCDAIGIGHALRLTGSGPLPPGAITVRIMPAGS